ncbi:hypothetical protein C4D60_Mb08t06980 [Musa balbisiana]|uniref:Uncharacterized protein n=1 Tax=Musa balbisiana TaxID=52838 RepID=A0A4S8K1X2_MUSBA|nr:hypothetical protein C4D60_Mb08t06980 [Musa balbisiana]
MHWVKADAFDFGGNPPLARSGHTAVNVGKSKVVVFGGFADKRFLDDIAVYDIENRLWFTPECTGSGSDEQVGPSPRAFHVAVAIDCNMFIFGGRSGGKRMGDFWMLDTDIWQWSELTSYGDLPSPREFAAASAIGNRKIVMYGGWDGKKWLSDVYILDTISLEWTELSITGSVPQPRCGHSATMVEKRLLIFGGRGGGGPIMSDLWALKGLIDEENETPGWTQLKLPGQNPSPRCGHTVTSGGHYLLLFGGHGTGGWLSRYDIYHNDCIILDRDDPIAKRFPSIPSAPPESQSVTVSYGLAESSLKENQNEQFPLVELQKRLGIMISSSNFQVNLVDEVDDKELFELSSRLAGESLPTRDHLACIQALRDRWKKSNASSIQLQELGPLLHDYQRLIIHHLGNLRSDGPSTISNLTGQKVHRYFHLKSASQLRMDDIPKLLDEYKRLVS